LSFRIEMANLAINRVCNLNCPYCFTQDHWKGAAAGNGFVDVATFGTWLDFLDRSQIDQVRLLGGEPTLHPSFAELVGLSRARGKRIMVFSNGLMPEPALRCLENLAATECTVLVNVNEPALDGEQVHARRSATIRRLGERVMVGFNIYRVNFEPDFLLPIIAQACCQPVIRLGLAQPCLSGVNQHIRPRQYGLIGARIVRLAQRAAQAGVRLEFDCGFVRCMFSENDLQVLEDLGAGIGWRCNPILDIDVTGRIVHCYPLSRFMDLPLTSLSEAAELRRAFESHTWPYRQSGVFQACSTCPFKHSGECPGGCLAVTLRRFRAARFYLDIPQEEVRAWSCARMRGTAMPLSQVDSVNSSSTSRGGAQ